MKHLTYAELGEKIAKKIGKFETDLKSTEPDVRATAERTMPKLKQAMQSLMQSNEQEKVIKEATETRNMMAKGGYMNQFHSGGGRNYVESKAYGGRIKKYADGGKPETEAEQIAFQDWATSQGYDTKGRGWGPASQKLWDDYSGDYSDYKQAKLDTQTYLDSERDTPNYTSATDWGNQIGGPGQMPSYVAHSVLNEGMGIGDAYADYGKSFLPSSYNMENLSTDGQVDLTGGQGPYDESGIRPTEYGLPALGEEYEGTVDQFENNEGYKKPPGMLNNLYSAAQNAMVTAPFGYDYGPTDYYQSVYNPAEEQALGNLSEMEKQIAQARALAMEDTSIDTRDQRMAIEKARQRNLKSGATGPEKFALDQMANANAKDSMMQVAADKANKEAMLNSGAAKSARLAPLANAQAQLAQSRFGIGADRSGQDRYTKDAGLKTDAAMNALEMGKLSNMSKWAQMQQLMANKQGMDERSFQAMMNMYSDPAIREMYGNIG